MRADLSRLWVASLCLCLLGAVLAENAVAADRGPVRRKLQQIEFTYPPTDLASVAGIVPLGNLNPSGQHVLAVDHMYMSFVHPQGGGAEEIPVYAMASGRVVMMTWQTKEDVPVRDWQLSVAHSEQLAFYVDHVHVLSEKLQQYLETVPPGAWFEVAGQFALLFPGQLGAPPPPAVTAGEEIARARNYRNSWDVGVIDTRVAPHFEGQGPRRYPAIADALNALGLVAMPPYAGQKTLNAACFLDYLSPEMRNVWAAKLASDPKGCGRAAWDVPGKLRGAWFNPAVDAVEPPPVMELDWAALSVIPDNLAPSTRVQIAIPGGHPLCAFDPEGNLPQLANSVPFKIGFNGAADARINPNPAAVGPETGTVCYDLPYGNPSAPTYNFVLFHMTDTRTVAIKLDPTPRASPKCASTALPEPDAGWITYIR